MALGRGDDEVGSADFEVDSGRIDAGDVEDEFERIHLLLAVVMRSAERVVARESRGRLPGM
jgi:hypothetical protein